MENDRRALDTDRNVQHDPFTAFAARVANHEALGEVRDIQMPRALGAALRDELIGIAMDECEWSEVGSVVRRALEQPGDRIVVRLTPAHAPEIFAVLRAGEASPYVAALLDALDAAFARPATSPFEVRLPEWRLSSSAACWWAARGRMCLQAGPRSAGGCWWRVLKGDRGHPIRQGTAPTIEAARTAAFMAAPRTADLYIAAEPAAQPYDRPREELHRLADDVLREISRELGGPTHPRAKRRTMIEGIQERRAAMRTLGTGPDGVPSSREVRRRQRAWRDACAAGTAKRRADYADGLEARIAEAEGTLRLAVVSPELAASLRHDVEAARLAVERADLALQSAHSKPDHWPTKAARVEAAVDRLRIAKAKLVLAEREAPSP